MFRALLRHLLILATVVLLGAAVPGTAAAQEPVDPAPSPWYHLGEDDEVRVDFYFVWTETCPHCREARPFIEGLPDRFPWLELHSLPNTSQANVDLALELASSIGETITRVPAFMVCERLYTGYDNEEGMGAFLVERAQACRTLTQTAIAPDAPPTSDACDPEPVEPCDEPDQPLTLPVIGDVDADEVSLLAFTIAVAALDAFNPCAFFVLLFLLSLLVHARSRGRMLIIGGTFVLISGVTYFVFMAAWLNVFRWSGELRVVTTVAGLVAITLALLNIKDYFLPGRGPSASIPEQAQPGLFKRMRALTAGASYPAMMVGTVTLAIAANSYELLCTAGFPVVYTRVLTLNDLSTPGYYAYLGLYNLVYIIPLLAIVGVFVWRLGSRKLSATEGRVLKLASGLMMLGLGSALVFSPGVLSNLTAAAAILGGAILATSVIVLVDRWRQRQTAAPPAQ